MSRLLRALAAVAALASIGAPAPASGEAPRVGGTVTIGGDFEPACLSLIRTGCNQSWAHWSAGVALPGAFRVRPDLSYEPVLVESVDVSTSPFTLTYRIRERAVWSDGTPVSADDFVYTWQASVDPANDAFRNGYDRIAEASILDAKTVRFVFSSRYAPWRELFNHVLPRHVLAAAGIRAFDNAVANPATGQPIGSGPYLVESFVRGDAITLVRNPLWWGPHAPYVDRIVIRFYPDTNAQFAAIRSGEIELLQPQPQLQIADARRDPDLVVDAARGGSLEHLDFNVSPSTMPLLREPWFRRAIAHAIDREAVADALWATLDPSMDAQQNLIHFAQSPYYQPHFARYTYSPATVEAIMGANACERGTDGIWSCGGVRASVRFATTAGNQLRELAQSMMQDQARAAGIELRTDNASAAHLFGTRLPALDYDLIMFAWILGDPAGSYALYGCGGSLNSLGYCSPTVTDLLERAAGEVDADARAALANDADAQLAEDLPSLPLFVRPTFLITRKTLHGAVNNPSPQGPTWNVEDWWTDFAPADAVPPVTTAVATPAANAHGWNNGPVTVALSATDEGSGVAEIAYELAGGTPVVVAGSSASVTVAAEGTTTLRYWARDAAGNAEEAKTLVVRIDTTPPSLTCAASPNRLWPPNGRLVPVDVAVDVVDSLSGANGFSLVSVASDEPEEGSIDGFDVGTADTSGAVRADRSARGDGRTYSLVYAGEDLAGNTATCTANVDVPRDIRP